jgi:hypothetical protein
VAANSVRYAGGQAGRQRCHDSPTVWLTLASQVVPGGHKISCLPGLTTIAAAAESRACRVLSRLSRS